MTSPVRGPCRVRTISTLSGPRFHRMTLWIDVSRLACCEFLCLPVARLLDASRLACCEFSCLPVARLFGAAMAPRTRMTQAETQRVDKLRLAGKSPLDAPERQKVGASLVGRLCFPSKGSATSPPELCAETMGSTLRGRGRRGVFIAQARVNVTTGHVRRDQGFCAYFSAAMRRLLGWLCRARCKNSQRIVARCVSRPSRSKRHHQSCLWRPRIIHSEGGW